MELRKFISKTLEDILLGAKEAQDAVAGSHVGTVAPFVPERPPMNVPQHITCFQNVSFEIVVTVEEKAGSEATISVLSALVNGRLKGNSANDAAEHSKITFAVPIYFSPRMIGS